MTLPLLSNQIMWSLYHWSYDYYLFKYYSLCADNQGLKDSFNHINFIAEFLYKLALLWLEGAVCTGRSVAHFSRG